MAIDPDLVPILAGLQAQIDAISSGPPVGSFPSRVFTPKQADLVNDWMIRASRDDGGGRAILTGDHHPSTGYRIQPGCWLDGQSHPTMYSQTVNITPDYEDGAVFTFTDGVDYGPRRAWGGSSLSNLQVNPQTEHLTLIEGEGGNGSRVENVSTSMGRYPMFKGISVDSGRAHDFQYSTLKRVRMTRVIHAVDWFKNAPDCVLEDCMFYMGSIRGSTGLRAYGNNLQVDRTHFQFVDEGLYVNAKEVKINFGSWENKSGDSKWASFAFAVGPKTEDLTVRSLSLANFGSLGDNIFQLDPDAVGYTFEYLSGAIRPRHVPKGFEDHFVWHLS